MGFRDVVKHRVTVADENEYDNRNQQNENVGGHYNQYGEYIETPQHDHRNAHNHHHYHGWSCSPRNLCWGLFWLIGFTFLVLGVSGFGAAIYNNSRITTLQADVATLKSTTASQQALIDKAVVPFDHTTAGPLQIGPKTQYISVVAVAAMTIPGDLSSYLDDPYCIISKTAFAHTITMGAGATWDGANTIATFGGAVGDTICFHVFSSTQVTVTGEQNMAFS